MLRNCINILGEHYRGMLEQDLRNRDALARNATNAPSSFNTKHSVLPPKM